MWNYTDIGDTYQTIYDTAATAKNNFWRGCAFGGPPTAAQYAAIADGSFKNLCLGDYWDTGGEFWRIVDFDYWYNTGDTPCTTHHVIVMPDRGISVSTWNNTNTTAGGYANSKIRKESLKGPVSTKIKSVFGEDHILTHREHLSNAVSNGVVTGGAWLDCDVELPSEVMMYGCAITNKNILGHTTYKQLAAMRLNKFCINYVSQAIPLRDVVSNIFVSFVTYDKVPGRHNADYASYIIRPMFALKG